MTPADALKREALALGFDAARITDAPGEDDPGWTAGSYLRAAVAAGHHGSMEWIAETLERRVAPRALWTEARSALVVAQSYAPAHDPREDLEARAQGNISVYARGGDYHETLKGRLKTLAGGFAARTGAQVKVFVDTAPLMEKPLAARAGLGWQGKHTNLLSRDLGNWFFLGVMLTDAVLAPDAAEAEHCGTCSACLDACPTQAFPRPFVLDARRCISYLTIEHSGPIPVEFRAALGNRVFGCDDCLAACPWNKFAVTAREAKLHPRAQSLLPDLDALASLDEAGFREVFAGSPLRRTGRARVLRNVLIAMGNSGQKRLVAEVLRALEDDEPLIRGAAVWALARLDPDRWWQVRERHLDAETDPDVRAEWSVALAPQPGVRGCGDAAKG
jgi:epoxyqueuosine reductase